MTMFTFPVGEYLPKQQDPHDQEATPLQSSSGEYLPKQQDPLEQEATPLQSSSVMATQGGIADDLFFKLAENIQTGEQMEALGRTLGFKVADINRYTETNNKGAQVTCKGTRDMLFDWRQTVMPCDQHLKLKQALIDAKMVMLADTHLKGIHIIPGIYNKKISASLTVERCREKLENKYRKKLCKIQMKPWDQSDYAELEDMHTAVTMVKKDANGQDTKKKEKLNGSEIFSTKVNGELPARILISAPAGRGKTTAVAKMAHDWVHRKKGSALEHLPLLFVVKFRNTSRRTSIGEAIKDQLLSDVDDLTPEGLESFIRQNQSICHIILDGLDEYAGICSLERSSESNIVSVIRWEEFPECRVLVTTRPHLENIFNQDELPRVYTKMWIEGFSRESSPCELGIVSKTTASLTRLPQSNETTSTTIEFYHKLAQEHSAGKFLADQTNHFLLRLKLSKLDRVLLKIKANIGDYENLIRFAAGTDNNLCIRIMERVLANSFVDELERYRILLDCSSETKGTEGNVSSLVQRCVNAESIVLKSPTVYTVVGMQQLPKQLKRQVMTIKFEGSTITTDVTSGLWSCLGSFSMLRTLTVSDSSLNIDIIIDDAERDIPQITACLRRTCRGQQHIYLTAPSSLPSEKNSVSRETIRGMGLLIREQTNNLQGLLLTCVKCTDEEDLVELVECCKNVETMNHLM
eukprot:XP_011667271.1 PREDICTED: uncharacterized protein LOC105439700 [Strongylocentrotus purpuratus]